MRICLNFTPQRATRNSQPETRNATGATWEIIDRDTKMKRIFLNHRICGGNLRGAECDPGPFRPTEYMICKKIKKCFLADAISDLKKNRIILVGEHHTNQNHHFAQLNVIQSLNEAGVQVAIGLEMFRNDSQQALDHWVDGTSAKRNSRKSITITGPIPGRLYRMIFEYAKKEKIPMIGLNVPRDITRQVSRKGFNSLSEEQKGKLANVSCRVDKEYMDYIKKAFGGHGHGKLNFTYFCEAQLVWDSAMAINTLEYLKKYPDAVVVLLGRHRTCTKRGRPAPDTPAFGDTPRSDSAKN